ncbi:hypothetical protein AB7M45_007894 [Bradyrhizobium elkanii]|nr:hypothetical protein [Bradyrhizobium elkanii]
MIATESRSTLVPTDVVAALSVLNGHARAFGCGRDAIYQYKGLVARIYAAAGQANARPVGVMAKCNYCLGTGKFFCQYNGQTDDPCRKCARSGYVFLRFTETTIEGHSWHHPWISEGSEIYRRSVGASAIEYDPATRSIWVTKSDQQPANIGFGFVGDWQPNSKGEGTVGERAAELLNTVEDWLFATRPDGFDLRWDIERAQRAATGYSLRLGWIGDHCHYCGEPNIRIGQGHYVRPFEWTVRCCEVHSKMEVGTWDKRVPPAALTPAVLKWAERRSWSADKPGAAP